MAEFILSAFSDEAADALSEQIRALVENGIYQMEPRNINGKGILTLTDEELYAMKGELDAAGVHVYSLGSPIGKYPIEEPFEPHFEQFRRALEICKILGARNMRMFSFFVKEEEREKYRDEVMLRMQKMLTLAKEYGVRLCHENESSIYGQMPAEVEDLCNTLPELSLIFDGANYRMHDADCAEGIRVTLKRLAYLHIKDAIFATKTIVAAGEGEANIPEVLRLVDEATDARITLTLEPHLALFTAYKSIDKHELAGKERFSTMREAFNYAVSALKKILIDLGFKEGDMGVWKK